MHLGGTVMSKVLVTGGSGFVGGHCILRLVQAGHEVRTTVRDQRRESQVRATLQAGGLDAGARLDFVAADLENDKGWAEAAAGCSHVLHVASPFPATIPKDANELIRPARDGTLRVLRAARDAGVTRVVLTSSSAAIAYGHPPQEAPFDETNWTRVEDPSVAPYQKSKTLAERAAWDFIAREGGALELCSVNPVGIFGPVLGSDFASSIMIIQYLLEGRLPAVPQLSFNMVDVRDVAELHLRAMTHPAAKGERFLAVAGECMAMLDIARLLKERLGGAAKKVPTRQMPNWLLRCAALFDRNVRGIVPELGNIRRTTGAKARRVFDWTPRTNEESILASAESLLRLGLVKGA